MGYFDDLFKPEFIFDTEHQQRADIERLQRTVDAAPDMGKMVGPLADRVDRLELLCKSLTELIVSKGLATREELSVVTQQLDLADGVEDGKISARVRKRAPRCGHCGRFINPRRDQCVYCHEAVERDGAGPPPVRLVKCGSCLKDVAESDTFYTGAGLRCGTCYDPAAD